MPDLYVNSYVNAASRLLNPPKKRGKPRGRKPKAKKVATPPPPSPLNQMYENSPAASNNSTAPATSNTNSVNIQSLPPLQFYNDFTNEYHHHHHHQHHNHHNQQQQQHHSHQHHQHPNQIQHHYAPPPPPPASYQIAQEYSLGYEDMVGITKMMTMDITKTEPNVGPNSLQNTNGNQQNSNPNSQSITAAANNNNNNGSQLCAGCGKHIQDRFLLRALDMLWHEDCLKCGCCDCRLGEVGSTLYTKGNLMLCKRDYLRLFGNTGYCAACSKVIPAFEMVMRARTNVYHLECFACQQCNHRFCVGDRFYLCENKILCEYDYEERLVFASMANHPMLKRHANSISQDSANNPGAGAAGGVPSGPNTPNSMMGNGGGGPRTPGDLNNNGPQSGSANSPFGASTGAHMKNSLGASS